MYSMSASVATKASLQPKLNQVSRYDKINLSNIVQRRSGVFNSRRASDFAVSGQRLSKSRCQTFYVRAQASSDDTSKQPADDILPEEMEELTPPLSQMEPSDPALDFAGIKKALVAGANGKTGSKIVQKLVSVGVPVVALVRDKSKIKDVLKADGVTVVEGDVYQYQSLPRAMAGCDAVVCATGASSTLDPLGPFSVDFQGTTNLVTAADRAGVKKFVYVTSIGTDDPLFPLNLFWGVLFWKKRAEEVLQRSGIDYTIVRPGGLLDKPREGSEVGNIVMSGPDTYGLPPREQAGSILRDQVADVCVTALVEEAACNAVVEVIAKKDAPEKTISNLFADLML